MDSTSLQQRGDKKPQRFALFGFHFDEFDADTQRRGVPDDRIGLEWLRSGEDFHVNQVTHRKVLFRFQKRPAYGEISNACGPAAGSGNGRTQVRLHVDA